MKPGGTMPSSQGLSNNPYPESIQPNSRIDTYFFKIHSNIVLPSTLGRLKVRFYWSDCCDHR